MPKALSTTQIAPYLSQMQGELGATDAQRLAAITQLLRPPHHHCTTGQVLPILLPGSTSLASQNKTFNLLRQRFNALAESAGHSIRMHVSEARSKGSEREVFFAGQPWLQVTHSTDELTRVGSRLITGTQGLPLHTEPRISLQAGADGKPVVRWFLSYAHDDKDALKLCAELKKHLTNSPRYAFDAWTDHDILVGEQWHSQIQTALMQ